MKPIYVTLIAVGTGIAGFVGGTSLGLWGGAVSGGFVGGLVGSATGACMTVDAATAINILTPDQAEKIGVRRFPRIRLPISGLNQNIPFG
jgi:hypothetical protein